MVVHAMIYGHLDLTIRFIPLDAVVANAMDPYYSLLSGCGCRAYRTRACVCYSWRIYQHIG